MTDPFDQLAEALASSPTDGATDDGVRVDARRAARAGIPEVILASHKRDADLLTAVNRLLHANGRVLVSRLLDRQFALLESVAVDGVTLETHPAFGAAVIARDGVDAPVTGGRVAVICAGTSDRAVAAEAALMAREMGCDVNSIADVGVAGLHRLVAPLRAVMAAGVDAIVVAAGMDGALPSVVAGLVDVPVIGLPVSVGYGHGGAGEAALMTMLQSCSPGIAVVNIDNGIGAGSMAALIANRVATARDGLR